MKDIKKYTDVVRYGKGCTKGVIKEGDIISITEKVDGANSSFILDDENAIGVSCFSRRLPLDVNNTLQGFYEWVNKNIVPIKEKLNPRFRYVGEWTAKHKIQYKEEYTKTFLLFSIWDEIDEVYLSDDIVISESKRLGLKTVEYFYYGKFISYVHMMSFVGKSNITKEPNCGEGVVVKNIDYLNSNNQQVFVKLVSVNFAEIQKQKLPKNPNIDCKDIEIIKSILTKARVDKNLHKLVDEDLIKREEFEIENIGKLLKLLGNRILDDMIKEENEYLCTFENSFLKRQVGKLLPITLKEVLKDYENSVYK